MILEMAAHKINILQSNLNSLIKNKDEAARIMIAKQITIGCFMETWLNDKNTSKAKISNYNIVHNNREDGYGGTAIYIKKGIKFKTIQANINNSHIQTTEIHIIQPQMTIITAYAAPCTPIQTFKNHISDILKNSQHQTKTFIAADWNCHHTMWGNAYNDNKGTYLVEEIEQTNLCILHNNESTYIPTDSNKQKTAIDLTIVSEDIMTKSHREVLDHHMGATNHKTIITFIEASTVNRPRTFINKKQLMADVRQMVPRNNENLTKIIKTIQHTIKKHRHKQVKKPKIWWNKETERAWHIKNNARQNLTNNRTIENKIEYNRALAKFRHTKKLHKIDRFENKLKEINALV